MLFQGKKFAVAFLQLVLSLLSQTHPHTHTHTHTHFRAIIKVEPIKEGIKFGQVCHQRKFFGIWAVFLPIKNSALFHRLAVKVLRAFIIAFCWNLKSVFFAKNKTEQKVK